MRRLSTSERTVNPAGYAKPEELDADRAIKEHALIDGQDIATVSRGSLRQQIAYVGQAVHLFRGSIRDNIALGR